LTSAAITGVTDFAGDLATHKRPGWSDLGDVAFNAVTAGVGEYLPGVPGRLPYIFSNAFFTGSHTQNAFAQNLAGASIQLAIANAAPLTSNLQLGQLKAALQAVSSALANYSPGAHNASKSTKKQ